METQLIVAPEAGRDYPRNWNEFLDRFASKEPCSGYLEKLRWPSDFVCPGCGVAQEPYHSNRALGLGSQQAAGAMLHRFRRAMVRPDRDRLKAQVEVDETYLAITDREAPFSPVGRKNKTTQVLVGVASLVTRWILGTHHGSVQPGSLDVYLDESVFRFNRRRSGSRGTPFYRLLQQAVVTDPVTYDGAIRALPKPAKQG